MDSVLTDRRKALPEWEADELRSNPPDAAQFSLTPFDDELLQWNATIIGPEDSDYWDGTFKLTIEIKAEYPRFDPIFKFITPIYHPNIGEDGTVHKLSDSGAWTSTRLRTFVANLRKLLAEPDWKEPWRKDLAEQYKKDAQAYKDEVCRQTVKHAMTEEQRAELED